MATGLDKGTSGQKSHFWCKIMVKKGAQMFGFSIKPASCFPFQEEVKSGSSQRPIPQIAPFREDKTWVLKYNFLPFILRLNVKRNVNYTCMICTAIQLIVPFRHPSCQCSVHTLTLYVHITLYILFYRLKVTRESLKFWALIGGVFVTIPFFCL